MKVATISLASKQQAAAPTEPTPAWKETAKKVVAAFVIAIGAAATAASFLFVSVAVGVIALAATATATAIAIKTLRKPPVQQPPQQTPPPAPAPKSAAAATPNTSETPPASEPLIVRIPPPPQSNVKPFVEVPPNISIVKDLSLRGPCFRNKVLDQMLITHAGQGSLEMKLEWWRIFNELSDDDWHAVETANKPERTSSFALSHCFRDSTEIAKHATFWDTFTSTVKNLLTPIAQYCDKFEVRVAQEKLFVDFQFKQYSLPETFGTVERCASTFIAKISDILPIAKAVGATEFSCHFNWWTEQSNAVLSHAYFVFLFLYHWRTLEGDQLTKQEALFKQLIVTIQSSIKPHKLKTNEDGTLALEEGCPVVVIGEESAVEAPKQPPAATTAAAASAASAPPAPAPTKAEPALQAYNKANETDSNYFYRCKGYFLDQLRILLRSNTFTGYCENGTAYPTTRGGAQVPERFRLPLNFWRDEPVDGSKTSLAAQAFADPAQRKGEDWQRLESEINSSLGFTTNQIRSHLRRKIYAVDVDGKLYLALDRRDGGDPFDVPE
jgi:hypothetical protein